jgi:protein-disulfide isomerase
VSKNLRISLVLIAVALVGVVALALSGGDDTETVSTAAEANERVVRPDSQRLQEASGSDVTFVEFLDFECEACRAAHPAVEDLRERYEGEVTFVVRNFPLHRNSESAARAAEAAAAQGKFEEMYDLLFETQPEWGESSESKEQVFFGLAEQLDLDMDRFREVYDDPATLELIKRDQADGRALGVQGTPTFFLNGEKIEPRSFDEIIELIDAAIAE